MKVRVKSRQPATFELRVKRVGPGLPNRTFTARITQDSIVVKRDDGDRRSISWEDLLGVMFARGAREGDNGHRR